MDFHLQKWGITVQQWVSAAILYLKHSGGSAMVGAAAQPMMRVSHYSGLINVDYIMYLLRSGENMLCYSIHMYGFHGSHDAIELSDHTHVYRPVKDISSCKQWKRTEQRDVRPGLPLLRAFSALSCGNANTLIKSLLRQTNRSIDTCQGINTVFVLSRSLLARLVLQCVFTSYLEMSHQRNINTRSHIVCMFKTTISSLKASS